MKSSRLPGGRRPSNRMFRCSNSFSEAWREGRSDYATVAMKFALKDSIVSARADAPLKAATGLRSPSCGRSCAPVAQLAALSPPADVTLMQFINSIKALCK